MAASTPVRAANITESVGAPHALNVALLIAGVWFLGGLLLDGWAHNNLDLSKEGFFTPYHAVFYSGFVAFSGVLGVAAWRGRTPQKPWYAWFPPGYEAMALGIAVFAAGGFLDMLWHIAFGVERDIQALFSPTHLLLATGGAIMMTGPIRAGLLKPEVHTWRDRFGELTALAFFGTLVMFFCMWAFDTAASHADDPHRAYPALAADALAAVRDLAVQNGIAAIIMRSLVGAGIAGWAARRYALPFGGIAFLVTIPNVLIALMIEPSPIHVSLSLAASLVSGFAGDVALARWGRGGLVHPSWRTRAFAFGVPFVFWTVYMLAAYIALGPFWWSIHEVFGAPIIGGLAGLLLALTGEEHQTKTAP